MVLKIKIPAKLYDYTLGFINEQRKIAGRRPIKKIPTGRSCSSCECPVAQGLGGKDADKDVGRCFVKAEGVLVPITPFTLIEFFDLVDAPVRDAKEPCPDGQEPFVIPIRGLR